ncbi:MAG: hypothetical protein ACI89L_002416 [Phycisphaerales bacterium]|jgi:uncharacterized protein (DUF1800 family)
MTRTTKAQPIAQPSRTTEPDAAPLPGDLKPIRGEDFGYAQARHLLWRAGFGGTPEQVQTLAGWGPEKSVDYLIDFEKVDYEDPESEGFDSDVMRPASQAERTAYRQAQARGDEDAVARFRSLRQAAQRDDRQQFREMQRWWVARMIETPRPLEEKMTLFWHGHFAASYRGVEDSWHMLRQNQFFRTNAVGSFADLLHGIIRDPAMLAYLNNNQSTKRMPNENLAREIMELFSLGEGNYTEQDIKQGARALTGYSFDDDEFVFRQNQHDSGNKRILGINGGLDGDGFVNAILSRPECSRFIAAKLYRFFCRDIPLVSEQQDPVTRRVVSEMASSLRQNSYRVAPVLRRLLLSRHFHHESVRLEQIKSPAVLVVGLVRSLNTPPRELGTLTEAMTLMGQTPMAPPSVKGWEGGTTWINTSTLFARQNIAAYLLTGRQPRRGRAEGSRFDPDSLMAPLRESGGLEDPAVAADYLLRFAMGRTSTSARATLVQFVSEHGGQITPPIVTGMLLLITAMPEYQLC